MSQSRPRVLIPLDGSRLSERIVPRLQQLLQDLQAEALLLHVQPADTRVSAEDAAHAVSSLDRMQDQLRSLNIASTVMQRGGDPADVICHQATELAPWIIAMSTHGRSGIGRWWSGSVTERVLRHATRPVLAANPGAVEAAGVPAAAHPFAFQNVLVPLDGSARARAILAIATPLVRATGGRLHLAHVAPTLRSLDAFPAIEREAIDAAQQAEAGAVLETAAADLGTAAPPITRHVLGGHPAHALLELAERIDADGVALTTHGRTGMSRWAFGSVAEKLVRHAICPVLVWRAPEAT